MRESQSQRELRGVPLVGGRRSSAVPGTDPLPAVLNKDQRGRLWPRPRVTEPIPRGIVSASYERKGRPLERTGTIAAGRFFLGT